MDPKVVMYVAYLVVSVGLTVWVATTLSRNGLVFLREVFDDDKLAVAVNQLLVMGFYLLNLGYVTFAMRSGAVVDDASEALETLSQKLGLVLLVLGGLHFLNVYVLSRYRRSRIRASQPPLSRPPLSRPPLPPAGRLPVPPPPGFPLQGTIPPPATA